jgi:hypothetical protein
VCLQMTTDGCSYLPSSDEILISLFVLSQSTPPLLLQWSQNLIRSLAMDFHCQHTSNKRQVESNIAEKWGPKRRVRLHSK